MEKIRYGTTIRTAKGYLLVVEYDGTWVTIEEYEVSNGDESMIDVRDITLEDLSEEMTAIDGKRHSLYWDASITCENCPCFWSDSDEADPYCHFERVMDIPAPCEQRLFPDE